MALRRFRQQGSDQVLHSGLVETLLVHHLLFCSLHPGAVSQSGGRAAGKRAFSQTASFTAARLQPDSNAHNLRCDAGCRQGTCTFCDDLSAGTLSGALSHRALFQKAAAPRNYRIHGAHLLRRRSADPASGCHLQHFFAGLFDLYYFYRCSAAVALP